MSETKFPSIDLNCDLGESDEAAQMATDAALLRVVTSANIACGGHAGDEGVGGSMERTVREAMACGVAIGAHPSYPDRAQFGRVQMEMSEAEIEKTVAGQIGALVGVARRCGAKITHVKPHGALYHAAMKKAEVARAIGRAVVGIDAAMVLVGQAGGAGLNVWCGMGLRIAAEAFADRRYEADGSLRSRTLAGALIEEPAVAATQAVAIAIGGDGDRGEYAPARFLGIPLRADTICVHGDTPGAGAVARAVRQALEANGVRVRPLA